MELNVLNLESQVSKRDERNKACPPNESTTTTQGTMDSKNTDEQRERLLSSPSPEYSSLVGQQSNVNNLSVPLEGISVDVQFSFGDEAEEGLSFQVPSRTSDKGVDDTAAAEGDDEPEEEGKYEKKQKKHRRRRLYANSLSTWPRGAVSAGRWGCLVPPENVHSADWRDMVALTDLNQHNLANNSHEALGRKTTDCYLDAPLQPTVPLFDQMRFSGSELSLKRQHWISSTFLKRECAKFIPTHKDPEKCCCGRMRMKHRDLAELTSTFLACRTDYTERGGVQRTDDESAEDRKILPPRRHNRTVGERWSIKKHTMCLQTDSFGQIEFQGGPHPYKAQYVRLSFDTDPVNIMALFEQVWNIQPPKLIITVHGGMTNFDLQPKLARVFRKGLLKAARTTGAWIITSGVDAGVVRHVAAALQGAGSSSRSKIVCIGITPWGTLKKREDLEGQDIVVPYHPHSFHSKSRNTVLNNRHSFFLLVDNGTVGRYGADVILRRRLEMYIAQKQKIFGGTRSVPVVCVVLEGGASTIRTVLDYVTNVPRVPVVVCDGSGRASDLLAFAHQEVQEDGSFRDDIRPQLVHLVQKTFGCDERTAEKVMRELSICAQQKHLMTVFRLGERGKHDVDYAILTALLKGQNLSAADQLALALAWNRVDIARSDVFVNEQEWSQAALHNAMMEALIHDRVDFVRLLLEKGVSMQKFLTIGRLEELYNTDKGPQNTLFYILRDVVKVRQGYQYKLPHIGMVMEKLMGNAYQCYYTSYEFRQKYSSFMKKYKHRRILAAAGNTTNRSRVGSCGMSRQSTEPVLSLPVLAPSDPPVSEPMVSALSGSRALSNHILWRSAFRNFNTMRPPNLTDTKEPIEFDDEDMSTSGSSADHKSSEYEFRYPFSELLIWAVLTKRQEMALCMWQHGEEALAKALVACRLYKSLAKEAAEDYLEVEICEELKKYAEEFRNLSLGLLDHCYQADDTQALQLLTYELKEWGHETCLSLSVIVNNKQFLAHPACQILLADLWHGGLRIRSHSNAKVLMGLLCPLSIIMLEFKTREELLLQPQTAAEHEQDINDSSSSSSSDSDDGSSSSYSDSEEDQNDATRRNSHGSLQSLNTIHLGGLFHRSRNKRAGHKIKNEKQEDGIATVEGGMQKISSVSTRVPSPSAVRRRPRTLSLRVPNGPAHLAVPCVRPYPPTAKEYGSADDLHSPSANGVVPSSSLPSDGEEFSAKRPQKGSFFPGNLNLQRMKPIKFRRRFYEFYAAPITKFWSWTISFAVFLAMFTYVLLIRTPPKPTVVEWILCAYVLSFGMEHIRKFVMSDMEPVTQKVKYFFFNYWNTVTAMAVVTFIIGFAMRTAGMLSYGRVVLACNSVLWTMKLLDYMSVHPRLGPYVTMAGKMILNMSYVIVMLVVSLLAFGLARQSITYPNEEWHWLLVRNIFYKPYFMLYGEVYADEIDQCGDDAWDQHLEDGRPLSLITNGTTSNNCVPGYWIPPILMTFFLLVANILLMSMLIAIFNHIFDQTEEFSQQIWLFQRYRQVMEYESTPFFPPPFTFFYHIYMVVKYVRWRIRRRRERAKGEDGYKRDTDMFDFSLKLFLSDDQVEKLHDFEEDCMEELARNKEQEKNTSSEERIMRTSERTELIVARLNDLTTKESIMRENMREMEGRLELIENKQGEILDCVRQMASTLPFILSQLQRSSSPSPSLLALPQQSQPQMARGDSFDEPSQSSEVGLPRGSSQGNQMESTGVVAAQRKRTSTICGIEDQHHLSPSIGVDTLRFGSLSNLTHATSTLNVAKKESISQRRQQRHEEYTSITDTIAVGESRRRERGRDTDEDNLSPSAMNGGGGGSDDGRDDSRGYGISSPPHASVKRIRPKMSNLPSTVDEENAERLREEDSMADCELTELEREDEREEEEDERYTENEETQRKREEEEEEEDGSEGELQIGGLVHRFNVDLVNEVNDSSSLNPLTPPEPRPSPELGKKRVQTSRDEEEKKDTVD